MTSRKGLHGTRKEVAGAMRRSEVVEEEGRIVEPDFRVLRVFLDHCLKQRVCFLGSC